MTRHVAALAVLLAVVVAVYWQGLNGPLIMDDHHQLGMFFDGNDSALPVSAGDLFTYTGMLGRPVAMASFVFNHAVSGIDPWSWKLTNLVIHLLSGLLIYFLTRRLLGYLKVTTEERLRWIALLVAAVWLLHPLQVSTVLYLVQRMAQLSALFALAAMLLYACGRERQIQGGTGHYHILAALLVAFPLSAFSKENGLLVPLYLLVMELFIYRFAGTVKNARLLKIGYASILVLFVAAAFYVLEIRPVGGLTGSYDARHFDLYERILTQFRVLLLYLQQSVFPIPSSMPFFYDNYPVSKGMIEPPSTVISMLAVIALLAGSWLYRRKAPLLCFGIFFFFVAHAMESTIVPLELVFEHRNYLALYGIALVAALLIMKAAEIHQYKAMLVSILLLSMLTFNAQGRATIWATDTSFYNRSLIYNPGSERVRMVLANELQNQGRHFEALGLLSSIDSAGARIQSGYVICGMTGRLSSKFIRDMKDGLPDVIDNYEVTGIIELANLGLDGECAFNKQDFLVFLSHAAEQNNRQSGRIKLLMYKAHYQWELGWQQPALETIDLVHGLIPDSPVPLYLATEWLLDISDTKRAEEYFERANKLAGRDRMDYSHLSDGIMERFEEIR